MASCKENDGLPNFETQITTNTTTEDGTPFAGVEIRVTHDYANKSKNSVQYAKTDKSGNDVTSARSRGSVMIRTTHPLYYPTYEDEIDVTAGPLDYEQHSIKIHKTYCRTSQNHQTHFAFAKQNDTPFPEKEKWIEFDLEKADWVNPYGIGIETDVEFSTTTSPHEINRDTLQELENLIRRIRQEHSENTMQKQSYMESRDDFYNLPKGSSSYEDALKFRLHN